MYDPYTMMLILIQESKSDAEIARTVGWPEDAIQQMRQEVECAQRGDCNG